ncbi:hypothetical protein ADEAN_000661200 [Angomonas deanei]|uniref:Uncharacterized protein n=1 Tax=Angomonas deanei TaxID=59799 RepID=A0A7G2CI83_9TRYP|nr:hypothetical protein ADEAN_000661200 [Angomonas deanei]
MQKEDPRPEDSLNRSLVDDRLPTSSAEDDYLWGPVEPYTPLPEETASVLGRFYYTWIYPSVKLSSKERLALEDLPLPTLEVRARVCGHRLSEAVKGAIEKKECWNKYIGEEVYLTEDPDSRGILRWVGVPQQGGYKSVMAAVEWSHIPAPSCRRPRRGYIEYTIV